MYYVRLHSLSEVSLLSNVLVERYEFANKQAQLKTVIDKMGDGSTRVSFTWSKMIENIAWPICGTLCCVLGQDHSTSVQPGV